MVTKKCSKCGEVKDVSSFSVRKDTKSGLRSYCKVCEALQRKAYCKENKDKIATQHAAYYKENKDKIAVQKAAYRKENKDKIAAREAAYYKENKDKIATQHAAYYKENKDKIAAREAAYRKENKDKLAAYRKENKDKIAAYRKENKDKVNAHSAKRRAKKLQRTPNWLTKEHDQQIKDLYEECQQIKDLTGNTYNVDHIWPLQGEEVSGLHVPWNLQILSEHENKSKRNKRPDSVKVTQVRLKDFT